MGAAEYAGFVGPAYETRSRFQDAQRCINLYPELDQTPGAKSVLALYSSPGTVEFMDLPALAGTPAAPVRLLYSPPSRPELALAVVGSKMTVFVQTGLNAYTFYNYPVPLASASGLMTAADNGKHILFSDGPNGYVLGITGLEFNKVAPPGNGAGFFGGRPQFLDGYFALNKPGTAQFYISSLYDVVFDPLDFATKEAWPDDIVTVWSEHRELWLLGVHTSEVWFNSGDVDFPFARNQGAFMQHGCAAPDSVSRLGDTFAFVATDERGSSMVVMASGYAFQKISTAALDYELSTYESVADAFAFTFRVSGHEFYQVTFPTANTTWVFDLTTNMWHQRASLDALGELNRHRANCFMNYGGRLIVGDHVNGKLYEMREDVYSDAGIKIPRIRRCPHIMNNRKQVRYHTLQVEFEPGVGIELVTTVTVVPPTGYEYVCELVADTGTEGGFRRVCEYFGVEVAFKYPFETVYQDTVSGLNANVSGAGGIQLMTGLFTPYQGVQSIRFTTADRYLFKDTTHAVGGVGAVPSNTEAFILSGWVQMEGSTIGNKHMLFGFDNSATGNMALAFRLNNDGNLVLAYRHGTTPVNAEQLIVVNELIPLSQWFRLWVQRIDDNLLVYYAANVFVADQLIATLPITNGVLDMVNSAKRLVMGPSDGAIPGGQPMYLDLITLVKPVDGGGGSTTTTIEEVNPKAMLRWSDDGGSTWSNEHWTAIGKTGEYKNRARWHRMGSARDRVYEVRVTDPIKVAIIGATLDATVDQH